MTARINPAFLLKGINLTKLVADYDAGLFNRRPTTKSTITISAGMGILAPIYGSTNYAPVYSIKDKNNATVVIATTGHDDLEIFDESGGELTAGGICKFCQKSFDHIPSCRPVYYREKVVLVTENGQSRYRLIYVFWVDTTEKFCCDEELLDYIHKFMAQPAYNRDTSMRDCESMLKMRHKLQYPKAPPLRPAQDPALLKSNGGSLTQEEHDDRRHIYRKTSRVLTIPVKSEYIQTFFGNATVTVDPVHKQGEVMSN